MKKQVFFVFAVAFGLMFGVLACQSGTADADGGAVAEATTEPAAGGGQASVIEENSEPNVVKVAIGSPDHTTLVAALKAADLVNSMANVGPFTVFAPTNAAFDALPAGTVEGLLKPEALADLKNVLKGHVTTSSLTEMMLSDGMTLGMANNSKITIHKTGDKIMINDANVLGVVKASNGMVYVIDKVLLPK
ncbi:MAG: fasciclin domain-containing protein [Saprospiraceae bacterium]|nr:fasciclin domain-containing protein [Saprospiraceae bacterium]MCF8250073.1 fasciclin domain-containing protein [Saprospiraceae bacterium]MCF8279535.1 fasciclin domain-containing protein [Bacteroidales bacterium]MCF8311961.1 fasciclin domain-containing protein [Saprospiraceae bacterium]MCF8440349.1 fasciclin domain-containing protein [Saprospiraceae bacterium]